MAGAIKRKNINGGARHALDKFYTRKEVAADLILSVEDFLNDAEIVIEPSAGAGAFSQQIIHSNLYAYDLEPEATNILKKDWFQVTRDDVGDGRLIVIGNPPFGVRSDLAKKFITHSVFLEAETIAFLLPKTFSKALNQRGSLFPAQYRLILEKDIPDDSFNIEGEVYHIPCRWYVWTKNTNFFPGVDLRKILLPDSPDFVFMPRGHKNSDFVLNGNSGRVRSLEEVTNPKAEHYIRVVNRDRIALLKKKFEQLEFDFNSSVNGGVAWVGKQEILAAYSKIE